MSSETAPAAPEVPNGRIALPRPPTLERSEGVAGVLAGAVPMLGGLGSILVVGLLASGGSGSTMRTRSLLAGGVFLLATLIYVLVQVDRQRRQHTRQVTTARADFLQQLSQVRAQVRGASTTQRRAMAWHHPDPRDLYRLVDQPWRLWRREPGDPLFLQVRVGRSTQALAIELAAPAEAASSRADPVAAGALQRFIDVHTRQPELPTLLDLNHTALARLSGPRDRVRDVARALICQAAATHAPGRLAIAVLCADTAIAQWDWLKWLPHSASPGHDDALGPQRMVRSDAAALEALLPADRHVLLIIDGQPPRPTRASTTTLVLGENSGGLHLDVSGTPGGDGRIPLTVGPETGQNDVSRGYADQLDLSSAERFARLLTPLAEHSRSPVEAPQPVAGNLTELLGLASVDRWLPDETWGTRSGSDLLRVPIGTDPDGQPVSLDLKESARHGMGPHGLVIGATGSGKSEFLRTLLLGLALTHSPDQLNLVLIDFKGGATFAGLTSLPHTSAVITNLASELTLVDRMHDALTGEMIRRQELLRAAGNYASAHAYAEARIARPDLAPLPSLFIVIDEFSELLSAKPELIELFVAIGRLGRSLGLHVLLASQRLDEGRLRGLESHLSYRIGLRTFSAAESRAVIGTSDAHHLPPEPGLGYLRPDPTTLQRFQAAFVSGPASGPASLSASGPASGSPIIRPFTVLPSEEPSPDLISALPEHAEPGDQPSLLDVAVERMAGHGSKAHRVWLPPLDHPDTLAALLPDVRDQPGLGLISAKWRIRPGLTLPLAVVDRPREQSRGVLVVDLAGAAGHVAVVGGPRSGRSTVLRTVVAALALTRTPDEVQFFLLDFGGGALGPLAGLPHVSGTAARSDPDVVRRIVAEVGGILDRREQFFLARGIDSIETYRTRRQQSEHDDDGYGDVLLVIEGWSRLRADVDDLEQDLQAIASRGLTFGVHLVVATSRWADFRAAARELFGTRLELRLGDPAESEVDRRAAALVPTSRPGRGLSPDGLQLLTVLPRIDDSNDPATLAEGLQDLVRRVAASWPGRPAPPLRLLPSRVDRSTLLDAVPADASGLLLGVEEKQLRPVLLDPAREPHLLVLGEGGSGKTATLRGYLREVLRNHSPRQAQIVLVDYRRSLLGEVPEDYLLHYVATSAGAGPVLQDLAAFLQGRLPDDSVGAEQLRQRSWWTGAEVHVVVDDYDLVAASPASPVATLQPLLAQARDVGLHLVVARRSGGASRALFDPVLQSLRELAQPGLLLSGDPEEGPLLGRLRPERAPPGRGRLVTRDAGTQVVQVAWTDPHHP